MARDLILPDRLAPSNLHLRPAVKARYVTGDLYDIAQRMREVDATLYAVELSEADEHSYAIMEDCEDGMQRLVFKVRELDGRVLEKLRYLMARPLAERIALVDAENHRLDAQRQDDELEQLYEDLGAPMWRELEQCGFIQRPASFPKLGVAAPGRAR